MTKLKWEVTLPELWETPAEEKHEEYYSVPEAIFGQHELTNEEKKEYEDYFSRLFAKREEKGQ